MSCFACGLHAASYTSNLPASVSITGTQSDTITGEKSKPSYDVTTVGYGNVKGFSITGQAGGKYSLNFQDNTSTWYSGGITLGANLEATINGVHALAIDKGGMTINDGASLTVNSSGNTINTSGTDYGGASKVRFAGGLNLNLGANSRAVFSNISQTTTSFIHQGTINVAQGANLTIQATLIRLQDVNNNNGTITLTGTRIQNIGNPVGGKNGIANFVNNNGNVIINGDFENGGQAINEGGTFSPYDPGYGGGAVFTLNGGSVTINGKFIATHGGDAVSGGDLWGAQVSDININGGTLDIKGEITNKTGSTLNVTGGNLIARSNFINTSGGVINISKGKVEVAGETRNDSGSSFNIAGGTIQTSNFVNNSTLNFSADSNGNMGQIIGNLSNNGSGKVNIDLTNAKTGEIQLVTGSIQGLQDGVNLNVNTGAFLDTKFDINSGKLTNKVDQGKIDKIEGELTDKNDKQVFSTLMQEYPGVFKTEAEAKQAVQDIKTGVSTGHISTPLTTMDTMVSNAKLESSRQIFSSRNSGLADISKLKKVYLASLNDDVLRQIISRQTNHSFNLNVVGMGIAGANKGFLGGFNASMFSRVENHGISFGVGYAYGKTKQDSSYHETDNSSHNFSLSLYDKIYMPFDENMEFDLGAYWAGSFMDISRNLQNIGKSSTKSKFFQLGAEGTLGYVFESGQFAIKPYLGLGHALHFFDQFSEQTGSISLSANSQNIYTLSALAGFENRFYLTDESAVMLTLGYENLMFESRKRAMRMGGNSNPQGRNMFFSMPYKHKASLALGTDYYFTEAMRIEVGGFYKYAFGTKGDDEVSKDKLDTHYFGVNASFIYKF
ncbi:hypothetical protein DMB92_07330 [Campylobacter sp. MIT 99-7217]|nr:hypothetical protein DMB92_07330 [Campylobacter sp. MIT 99-7217]